MVKFLLKSLLPGLAMTLTLVMGTAWAQLAIEGVPQQVREQLKKDLGEAFKPGASRPTIADEIIRYLMKTELFENVSVFEENGQLKVVAQPLRQIKTITFKGNRTISTRDLENAVNMRQGDKFEKRKVLEAGDLLKEIYGRRGYFNAAIDVNFNSPTEDTIEIAFNITENKPCIVTSVLFETTNTELKERLEGRARRLMRKPFTEQLVSDIESRARSYFKENRFLSAKLEQSKVNYNEDRTAATLVFEVKEPFRYQVLSQGNKAFSDSEVLKALNLNDYDRASIDPLAELSQKLRQSYLSEGFAHAQISTEQQEIPGKFLRRVRLLINEGPQVKIAKIEVTGRISRPAKYYADFIEDNSSDLIDRGYYNRDDLEVGYKNLVTHLKNQGYLKAKIQSARIEFSNNKAKANIQVIIDEGPLTQVRSVQFRGAKAFSSVELMEAMSIESNAPLRLYQLEESLNKLKEYYSARGYLEMTIQNEDETLVEYNESGTQANVTFEIYEGPRISVSAIALDGNSFTKSYVILREIDFEVGDILTSEKIETSRLRLNRLGLFSRVDIRTLEAGTNVSQRTVVISVAERYPGLFRVGFGAENETEVTIHGYTGFSYNNLWGTARAISARLEIEEYIKKVQGLGYTLTAGYLEPFLFNTRTRGRVNLSFFKELTNFVDKKTNPITNDIVKDVATFQQGLKVDFLIERDLTDHTKFTWTLWSLDSFDEFDVPRAGTEQTSQQVALMGPIIDVDYRDNAFLPTTGSHTRWSALYSDPSFGSSEQIQFYRTEASYNRYFRIGSPRFIWAHSIRGGYLKNLKENGGVPAKQAFFLGGYSTIRGFGGTGDLEVIPNRVELETDDRGTKLVVDGDSHFYLYKTEFRFPLYSPLGGVVFYDGGSVGVSGVDFKKPYRQSVGVGLRINTPVGPVVLDWAFKLDRQKFGDKKEEPYRIHFSIGAF